MSRRRNKYARPFRPLSYSVSTSSTQKSDGLWVTRVVREERAIKTYTCPECLGTIAMGTRHIVAWPHTPPIGSTSGVDFRRHFHEYCWEQKR